MDDDYRRSDDALTLAEQREREQTEGEGNGTADSF